jgi:hypothetical protein
MGVFLFRRRRWRDGGHGTEAVRNELSMDADELKEISIERPMA